MPIKALTDNRDRTEWHSQRIEIVHKDGLLTNEAGAIIIEMTTLCREKVL